MSGFRRPRRPAVPGEPCPAERTSKSSDPAVRITDVGRTYRKGVRTCGRCGRPEVKVTQSWGDRHSAWYYSQHTVPEKEAQS